MMKYTASVCHLHCYHIMCNYFKLTYLQQNYITVLVQIRICALRLESGDVNVT